MAELSDGPRPASGPEQAAKTSNEIASSDLPSLYRAASRTSRRGQRLYKRLIQFDLVVLSLGGVLGAFASVRDDKYRVPFAVATTVILVVGSSVKLRAQSRQDNRDWFNGRAVAETVKSLSWRYMMRYPPFESDDSANQHFLASLAAVRLEARRLESDDLGSAASQHEITDRMKEVRKGDPVARRDFYVEYRLTNQIGWYSSKAEHSRIRAEQWGWASLAFEVLAVLAAIMLILTAAGGINLVGAFGALAAATTAWAQVNQHDELARSYTMASLELKRLRDLALAGTDEDTLRDAVRDGEAAISREHMMWVAKRGESIPPGLLQAEGH
jgi:hypothetical protein